jgi:hypothetical protein
VKRANRAIDHLIPEEYSRAEVPVEVSMRTWILGLAIVASSFLLASSAAAQAAAEGALTHALSSGVGTGLGNAMGRATNQMAGRVAQQTSHAVPRQAVATGTKRAGGTSAIPAAQAPNSATTATPASGGSMIVSIQGAARLQPACATVSKPAEATAPATSESSVPVSSQATPAAANCAASADPTIFAHPSEITLPEMK